MSLSKNSLFNVLGAAIPLLIGAVSVPYLVAHLGVERFGILTLIWTVIGYFSLFDLGLGRAITQQVSQLLGANRHDEIKTVVAIGIILTLATGLLGAALMAAFSGKLSTSGFNVSPAHASETATCLLIAAIGVPLATISAGYRGALEAYEKFYEVNIAKTIFGVAIFGLPALGVAWYGNSLIIVTWSLVLARLALVVTYFLMTCRLPFNSTTLRSFGPREMYKVLSFGIWMGASSLVSAVLIYADRFVIAKLLGASLIAYYTVPFEIIVRLLIVPGAIGSSLLPRLSTEFVKSFQNAAALLRRATKVTSVIMLVMAIVTSASAYPVMAIFLGREFANASFAAAVILCVGVFLNGIANIPYSALHALGVVKRTGTLHFFELVAYLPVLYALVKAFGIVGAAVAWALRAGVDCAFQFYLLRRALSERTFQN